MYDVWADPAMSTIIMFLCMATVPVMTAFVLVGNFATDGHPRKPLYVDGLAWVGLSVAFPQMVMLWALYAAVPVLGFGLAANGAIIALCWTAYSGAVSEIAWMRGKETRGRHWRARLLTHAFVVVLSGFTGVFVSIDPERSPDKMHDALQGAVALGVFALGGLVLTLRMRPTPNENHDGD